MKRALVTGAAGFIGPWAVDALCARGFDVHAADLAAPPEFGPQAVWHGCDLLDSGQTERLLADVAPTHLLHLAWHVVPGEYVHSVRNIAWVRATLDLLEQFASCGGRRAVLAGTCAEYAPDASPCDELTTPLHPTTLYAAAKHGLQTVASAYARRVGMNLAWGRVFFLYGPREHPSRLVSSAIDALLRGERAGCRHGDLVRDFLHVSDVGEAFAALVDSDVEGPVNVASGSGVRLGDLIGKIASRLGQEDRIDVGREPAAGDSPVLVASVDRLRREVGFSPRFDLDSGLDDTIQWRKDNFKAGQP